MPALACSAYLLDACLVERFGGIDAGQEAARRILAAVASQGGADVFAAGGQDPLTSLRSGLLLRVLGLEEVPVRPYRDSERELQRLGNERNHKVDSFPARLEDVVKGGARREPSPELLDQPHLARVVRPWLQDRQGRQVVVPYLTTLAPRAEEEPLS